MPLPAANRLPLRKERDRLQKEGCTFHTKHFTIVSAPTTVILAKTGIHPITQVFPRFSILLSKKTARLAVDRNLIRRRTSALLAEFLAKFPPADYLVIPKRTVLDTSHTDLLADLASLKFLV